MSQLFARHHVFIYVGLAVRDSHPPDRSVDRGEKPSILVDADATDPTAIGNAAAALAALSSALDRDLPPVRQLPASAPPFQFVVHARYNPEQLTVLNVVPGLTCVILMMSTLFATTALGFAPGKLTFTKLPNGDFGGDISD